MGHTDKSSPSFLRMVTRLILFASVWTAAVLIGWHALELSISRNQLKAEVEEMQREYSGQLEIYAGLLAQIEKIETDHETQIELLKKQFGYAEPDETPIVILRQDSQ